MQVINRGHVGHGYESPDLKVQAELDNAESSFSCLVSFMVGMSMLGVHYFQNFPEFFLSALLRFDSSSVSRSLRGGLGMTTGP